MAQKKKVQAAKSRTAKATGAGKAKRPALKVKSREAVAQAAKVTKKPVKPVAVAQKPVKKPVTKDAVAKDKAKVAAAPVAGKKPVVAQPPKAIVVPKVAAPVVAAQQAPAPVARAVPAQVTKVGGQKITQSAAPAAGPPLSPKALAEKAAVARQQMIAAAAQQAAAQQPKKPISQRHGFKMNEFVVYPAHGVGRIIGIEEQEIAGMPLELFVIAIEKEKLTLRVPTGRLQSVRLRKLSDDGVVKKAMETLKGRARVKRTMWSRRAQEYVAKIDSGDLVQISEVVRDLYRSEQQPEQSYSERQLVERALDRMSREIAAVEKVDERSAVQRITEILSKSAKGRRLAESGATEEEIQAA